MKYRCWLVGMAVWLSLLLCVTSLPKVAYAADSGTAAGSEAAAEPEGVDEAGEEARSTEAESTDPEETETGETQTQSAGDGEGESYSWPVGPEIMGESGILMEVSTGMILYNKNMHAQYYPASITKILTALVVIENCEMDEIVTVPHEAVYMDEDKGSHIALDENEELTVEDCLYAILLASANDAAYSLAIHVAGSIEEFAGMMNKKAQELGCEDSHFVNPHGLPNEEHVTSAYDMALITREALKYDIFREISGTTYYEIQPSERQKDLIPMGNHHDMLTSTRYHYDGAFAGKPGYTVVAKNTLVTCAARNGMELICVTMKTEGKQVYVDTAALLDFGFDNYIRLEVEKQGPQTMEAAVHARTAGVESADVHEEEIPLRGSGSGSVVVPSKISFTDLDAAFYYDTENARKGESGLMEFSLGGRVVGSAQVGIPDFLIIPEETETESEVETIPEEEPEEREIPWIWPVAGALAVVALAGGGFLLGRRLMWKRRWRQRSRSLSSRRRRRRRRRF